MEGCCNISKVSTRREALRRIGGGFGSLGLAAALGTVARAESAGTANPMAAKKPHFPGKAKNVIFLYLNGGLSQIDSFDRKTALDKFHGQPLPYEVPKTEFATGNLMRSPFTWKKYGQNGLEVSEIFPKIGEKIDDFCVVRSMYTDIPNHAPSMMMMNSGHSQQLRPSLGSWIVYGLGTENQNLPGFVVLCPGTPVGGSSLWSSAFLPPIYQGTYIRNDEPDPAKLIKFLQNRNPGPVQRRQLSLLEQLNRERMHQEADAAPELESSIRSMEVAFRMQTEAPEVFDISKEPDMVRSRYGDSEFGRGCLTALRLVEKGVRVVQVYFGNNNIWDHHIDIMGHKRLAKDTDGPVVALIEDLKSRGLLDETLVLLGTEFGRTPVVHTGGAAAVQAGRDHNTKCFTVLLAGGGIKTGQVYGSTDDFGFKIVDKPVHVHDLHATMLHNLGFDHERLTYRYSGRDFRLTDVHGNVVKELLS